MGSRSGLIRQMLTWARLTCQASRTTMLGYMEDATPAAMTPALIAVGMVDLIVVATTDAAGLTKLPPEAFFYHLEFRGRSC